MVSVSLVLIVILANTVEAMTGFGSTLVALSLAGLTMPVTELVPVLLPLNLVLSSYLTVRYFGDLDRALLLKRLLPFTLIGLVPGYLLYRFVDSTMLQVLLGFFVLILSCAELVCGRKPDLAPRPYFREHPMAPFWLIGGGIMQGTFGAGGPLIVYYSSKRQLRKQVFRVTLSALWLLLNLSLTLVHSQAGSINSASLLVSAQLVPALITGALIGELAHRRVSEVRFRTIVFFLLLGAGGSLVAAALL